MAVITDTTCLLIRIRTACTFQKSFNMSTSSIHELLHGALLEIRRAWQNTSWSLAAMIVTGSLVVVLLADYASMLRLRAKLPPVSFPFPIVGNVLQLPKKTPWYKFEEWSKQYDNPLITVWFDRRPTITLNDAWTASDLNEKRANIYSSRPRFEVPGKVMGYETWNQT